jgi:hypothetical protein
VTTDGDIVDVVVRDGAAADVGQHVQQRSLSRLRRHLHLLGVDAIKPFLLFVNAKLGLCSYHVFPP